MFLDDEELERFLREEEEKRAFRLPSTITISLLAHLGLVLFLLAGVERVPGLFDPLRTSAVLLARQENAVKTRVRFFDAPKRPKESPRGPIELSDADRRAHGGDPNQPKSDRPFAPAPEGGAARPSPPSSPPSPPPASPPAPKSDLTAPSLLALRRDPANENQARAEEVDKHAAAARAMLAPKSDPFARPSMAPPSASAGAGGANNDDGGFVDQDALSFDTKWFDWGPYGAEMVRRIKRNWKVPDLARVGMKGVVVIRFFILGDGRIVEERILRSSGIPPFDNASFQAIADSSPLPPLPKELGSSREGVTVSFYYNMHPGGRDDDEPAEAAKGHRPPHGGS